MNKKEEIKKALRRGGLVVAERGTGKTSALMEILMEGPAAVIIVPSNNYRYVYIELINEKYPGVFSKREICDFIILGDEAETRLKGLRRKVYVDEWCMCNYRGPFEAAVTSLPFPITFV